MLFGTHHALWDGKKSFTNKKEIKIKKYLNRKFIGGGKNGNSSKDNGR
jgi:hypothetical protein